MGKKRILYFDVLNILACIAVIALHHNGIVHTYSDSCAWKTALIVEVAAYWAVPVFLMLTGATLMPYREKYDTKTFFVKRFNRAFIPFFAWSIIILVWKLQTGQFSFETFSFREIVNTLLNNKMENVYWYFPFLFSVYLLMPLISHLAENKCRGTLKYTVVTMFVLQSTIVPLAELCGIQWNGNFALPISSFLIFVFLGYLLSTEDISKKVRYRIYFSGICGAVIRYAAIYILSVRDGAKNTLFFNYGYFPSVMLACAVFVFARNVDWENVLNKIHVKAASISKLSAYSLGVYLIHRIVMYYELLLADTFGINNASVVWRTAGIMLTYLISIIIVALIKKIPYLEKIVP